MGAVYRAIQQPVGRTVALKVIRDLGEDADVIRRRFEQEAAVVARLRHPNTVTLYDFGVHQQATLYMVLELVEGRPLSHEIMGRPMPPPRAAYIVASVLDALVEAHALGLVHRDLKPDNVMLSDTTWGQEHVRVLDFGVAKVLGDRAGPALTETGASIGTVRYMAPEQIQGHDTDHRADIYALGAILYECLTGRRPFDSDITFEILSAHITQPPPPIEPELEVPEELEQVVTRALKKHPDKRFPNARAMAEAVRVAAGLPVDNSSTSTPAIARSGATAVPESLSGKSPPATSPGTGEAEAPPRPGVPSEESSGTSEELSSEIVAYAISGPGRARWVWPALAVAAPVVLGVGLWLGASQRGSQPSPAEPPPSPTPAVPAAAGGDGKTSAGAPAATPDGGVDRAPPPAPPEPPTPREKAEALDAEGQRLRAEGKKDEALGRFRAAATADPRYPPTHFHQAALHAESGAAWPAIAALEAYLELEPEAPALGLRLKADPSFSKVREVPEFREWLTRRGLEEAPAVEKGDAKPTKRKKRRRRRRKKKKGLDVITF